MLTGNRVSASSLAPEFGTDELACLMEFAAASNHGGRYLEIGTAAGGTLCQLMRCFDDARRPHFVVIDPMTYFTNQLEIVKKNLTQHGLNPEGVDLRVSTSSDAFPAAEAAREEYNFILIDGSHKIRYVIRDLLWTRLLKPGGVVCLHDYNEQHPGVMLPVERLLRQHPNYHRESLVGSLLVIRKDAASSRPEIGCSDLIWASTLSPFIQFKKSLQKRLRKAGLRG